MVDAKQIVFEEIQLPRGIFHLEVVTYILKFPEEIREWTLDLHYSFGQIKSQRALNVIEYCSILEKAISMNEDLIDRELAERFPSECSKEILGDWKQGLMMMTNIASLKKDGECSWTIAASKEEQYEAGNDLVDFIDLFVEHQELSPKEIEEVEELKAKILESGPEDRMRLLNLGLESLGSKKKS